MRWNNTAPVGLAGDGDLGLRLQLGRDGGGPPSPSPSKAQEEECFIFTEAFLSAGSLISPLHIFGNPAVGWIYGAERSPWEPEQGHRIRRFLPRPNGARSPLTFCLAEASLDTPRGWCQGPKTPDQARTTLGVLPLGARHALHYATASSVPFRSSLPSTHLASPTRLCS